MQLTQHGGLDPSGFRPGEGVLDLSVNLNPYGPPASFIEGLAQLDWRQYPDPWQREAREILAKQHGLSPENIWCSNGANEWIWALARSLSPLKGIWLSIEPQYSEWKRAAISNGHQVEEWWADEENFWTWDLHDLRQRLLRGDVAFVCLCQPNSPSGYYQDMAAFLALVKEFSSIRFCLDVSFSQLSHAADELWQFPWPEQLILVRSLTKDYALAGLRIGYGIADAETIRLIQQQLPFWHVNQGSLAMIRWMNQERAWLAQTRQRWLQAAQTGMKNLLERRWPHSASSTPFVMIRSEVVPELSQALWQEQRILIRSCASYGLDKWFRLSWREPQEMAAFWQIFDRIHGLS